MYDIQVSIFLSVLASFHILQDGSVVSAGGPYSTHAFTFDHVYDVSASQRKVLMELPEQNPKQAHEEYHVAYENDYTVRATPLFFASVPCAIPQPRRKSIRVIHLSFILENMQHQAARAAVAILPFCSGCVVISYIYYETIICSQVYDTTAMEVVDSSLQGYNATVFAYGQTVRPYFG